MSALDRAARLDAIRAAARVRAAVGIRAGYTLLADGRHEVWEFDRAAGVMRRWVDITLGGAIGKAREGR